MTERLILPGFREGYKKLLNAHRTCRDIQDVLDTFRREFGDDVAFLTASDACDDVMTKDLILGGSSVVIGAVPTIRGGFLRREPTTRLVHGVLEVESEKAGHREHHTISIVFLEGERSGVLKVQPEQGDYSLNIRFSSLPPQTTFSRGGSA